MSDPTPTSAVVDERLPDGGKAMQSAFVRVLASLVTAIAIFAIGLLVSAQSTREAGRMIVGAQKADGYAATLVTQFATAHGRPGAP